MLVAYQNIPLEKLANKFDDAQLDAPLVPATIQRHGQQQLDAPMKQSTSGSQHFQAAGGTNKQYSAQHKGFKSLALCCFDLLCLDSVLIKLHYKKWKCHDAPSI